jgi:hypothetical protein
LPFGDVPLHPYMRRLQYLRRSQQLSIENDARYTLLVGRTYAFCRITSNLDITPSKGLPVITHKASGLLYCPIVRRRNRE